MALCCNTKISSPPLYEVPHKGTMKSEIPPHSSVAKHGCASKKGDLAEIFQYILYKLKASFLWHIMRKSKAHFFVVLMFLCQNGRI
ncbi:hypothetical protein HMPREF2955_03845 [Prevotella sp. HMSC073D09]|nr:hypothetical protein HMPREF2955_03845 [Prevotella sp. HMSC073D09]